ncbi:MAG: peptidase T [Lachnospira sp.]
MDTGVIDRFLRYVKVDTCSDDNSDTFPSTSGQHHLAKMLYQELKDIGAKDVYYDEQYAYVYGFIPSTCSPNEDSKSRDKYFYGKTVAFIAHMDTSPEMNGKNVNPQIVRNYDGKDIFLGCVSDDEGVKKDIFLSPNEFPELRDYIGQDLITTDGTSLLGADDKAGISEIMSMASYLINHPEIKHGKIAIVFTPDEEIGAGVDHIDLNRINADYGYTVDGGGIGELEYENFNAASAKVTFTGQNVHPGEAKGKMINASQLSFLYDSLLPKEERPEYTQDYQGFYHLTEMKGCVESAQLKYIIRDHDRKIFEKRKDNMIKAANRINEMVGRKCVRVELHDQYYNMKEKIEPVMFLVDNVSKCMTELGITPKIQPIRGGTDGARLSFMGLPCPNICTGGHNYHGRYEYCCVQSMEKITELLINLACM